MESGGPGQLIAVVSARSDGATSLALGLAAVLGARHRTVLVDLNRDNAEIATFLNADESKTLYHLAYNAQLAAITEIELREHIQWQDGFAVLPGITDQRQAEQITPRSEEHTSELQSHSDLVCRLLLEKKKNDTYSHQRQPPHPNQYNAL